jgi:hypothetical protein
MKSCMSRGLIPNTENEYKKLGSAINDARFAGLIDWDSVEDKTRKLKQRSHGAVQQTSSAQQRGATASLSGMTRDITSRRGLKNELSQAYSKGYVRNWTYHLYAAETTCLNLRCGLLLNG